MPQFPTTPTTSRLWLPESQYENDNGLPDLRLPARDKSLSYHWRAKGRFFTDLFGSTGNRAKDDARNSVLTEAVLAYEAGQWVSYSRRRDHYVGRRYGGTAFTFENVKHAVGWAVAEDLVEEERARPGDHLRTQRQSRFRAKPYLVEAYRGAELRHKVHEVIRLRNEIGRLMPYADTDATCRMRHELQRINEFLRPLIIDLEAPGVTRTERHFIIEGVEERQHVLITPPSLCRVFNRGSWQLGGRLYGFWQSFPSRALPIRQRLLINSEPVVEPDYAALHARIVYALHDRELEGDDPYETGEFPRDEGKLAFLIALNAPTTTSAVGAISDALEVKRQHAAKLLKAITARHPKVAGAFGADIGVKLMRIDSDITLRAVKNSIKADIPVLPVHDSIITQARHGGRVAEIMERAFETRFPGKKPCPVRIKPNSIPHMGEPGYPLLVSSSPLFAAYPAFWPCAENRAAAQLNLFPDLSMADPLVFGRGVADERRRRGLSQRAFAELIGCRQPHVANVERGRDGLGSWSHRRFRELLRAA